MTSGAKGQLRRLICVDRGRELAEQVRRLFPQNHLVLEYERTIAQAVDRFERESFDLMLFSSSVAGGQPDDAFELLELLSAKCPGTQVLFFIQPGQIEMAHRALRAGTFHYAELPVSDEELRLLVETALERQPQFGPNLLLRDASQGSYFERMIGRSAAIQSVFRQIRQAAATDIPVLVTGETGTGKELVAHAIHEQSTRRERPYVPVHIGALPPDLVASELFGHEKGSFTGAINQRIGCFERAHSGTVFLDEVATIDEKMQISLLRLLETHTFNRVGGQDPITVDVRLIAASNADLMEEVRRGRFREDLFFRLDVLHIHLPPLRERHGDIALLIDHFIKQVSDAFGKEIRGISPDCIARLETYSWPGNVRELKNVVQRAVVMCEGDILRPEHLPQRLQRGIEEPVQVPIHVGMSLEEVERELIARTLEFTGRNRTRTAQILGISRRALYNKIKKFGLN